MAGTDGDESSQWLRSRTIRSAICVRETFGRVACERRSTRVPTCLRTILRRSSWIRPRFSSDEGGKGLLVAEGESGVCRVICFSPRHDLTLAKMSVAEIRAVVDVWAEQCVELGSRDDIGYVQIFENRGAMMGASNPHPHGQIWASRSVPNEVVSELGGQRDYFARNRTVLLCEYQKMEESLGERVVASNASFVAVVPFWAVWPFEVMVLPRRHVTELQEFTETERTDFAAILKAVTATYDQVFDTPFPYSMGLHPAPCDGRGASGVAISRSFLSSAVAVGEHSEVYGGVRTAGISAARHHAGVGGGDASAGESSGL